MDIERKEVFETYEVTLYNLMLELLGSSSGEQQKPVNLAGLIVGFKIVCIPQICYLHTTTFS